MRARRTDALVALLQAQLAQERFRANNASYGSLVDETGDRFLAWHCVVTPRADGRWSGSVALIGDGWAIGAGRNERRICRYAAAAANAIDANITSARDDVDVGTPLLNRNFLVISGSNSCPSEPRTESYPP